MDRISAKRLGREPVAHPVSHRGEDHLRLMALKIQLPAVRRATMFEGSFIALSDALVGNGLVVRERILYTVDGEIHWPALERYEGNCSEKV
jgi:hypothetical protein